MLLPILIAAPRHRLGIVQDIPGVVAEAMQERGEAACLVVRAPQDTADVVVCAHVSELQGLVEGFQRGCDVEGWWEVHAQGVEGGAVFGVLARHGHALFECGRVAGVEVVWVWRCFVGDSGQVTGLGLCFCNEALDVHEFFHELGVLHDFVHFGL